MVMTKQRPEIVVNVFSSLDGRLTTAPGRNVLEWTALGLDGEANRITHELYDELDCDGMISGSESLRVFGQHWVPMETQIEQPKKSNAYIVFDGSGRIEWAYWDETLLVVTREDVAASYLEQLEQKGIRYLQAGRGEQIDLPVALEKLAAMGFRRLGLSGGGGINGAFLRAGLVDEISLVLAPVAVGGTSTPTVFDAPDLTSPEQMARLELVGCKPVGQGAVWVHYRVVR